MTLLLGTVSKNNVVLTADGLSRPNPITGQGISSSNYQKIFPLTNVPIAIVHHGFNILKNREVGEIIRDFDAHHMGLIAKSTLIETTDALIQFVDSDAQLIFQNPANKGVIGFWIAGFSKGKNKPELFETCWPDDVKPQSHKNLVMGGDGKKFIRRFLDVALGPFHHEKVHNYNSRLARQYHATLYKRAEDKQAKEGENVFGGHKHQLVISKKECTWTIPPS